MDIREETDALTEKREREESLDIEMHKEKGERTYSIKFNASSPFAALLGLEQLTIAYAKTMNITAMQVLAVMAAGFAKMEEEEEGKK